jgi:hypothetical protein
MRGMFFVPRTDLPTLKRSEAQRNGLAVVNKHV